MDNEEKLKLSSLADKFENLSKDVSESARSAFTAMWIVIIICLFGFAGLYALMENRKYKSRVEIVDGITTTIENLNSGKVKLLQNRIEYAEIEASLRDLDNAVNHPAQPNSSRMAILMETQAQFQKSAERLKEEIKKEIRDSVRVEKELVAFKNEEVNTPSFISYMLVNETSIRIGLLIVIILSVQISLRVFIYKNRLATFYLARSHAIHFHLTSNAELSFEKIIALISPESLQLKSPQVPFESFTSNIKSL